MILTETENLRFQANLSFCLSIIKDLIKKKPLQKGHVSVSAGTFIPNQNRSLEVARTTITLLFAARMVSILCGMAFLASEKVN